ncbi:hypothetical protein cyc_05000 [Cyclospora cayetanensis]|uniref:Uncharacterized protein n=1 Tax=Cyclospora cayetanensis TaxID=88456 RepID=A0A1D3D156_9EIME|nr:hypothetical protein cyc_05000 [Cyclospora cayetanensis]
MKRPLPNPPLDCRRTGEKGTLQLRHTAQVSQSWLPPESSKTQHEQKQHEQQQHEQQKNKQQKNKHQQHEQQQHEQKQHEQQQHEQQQHEQQQHEQQQHEQQQHEQQQNVRHERTSIWRAVFRSIRKEDTLLDPVDLTVRTSILGDFLRLCRLSSLYTVTQVADDAEEEKILDILEKCASFETGLNRHRVMFCDTCHGAVSMIRQLQPQMHIEDNGWITTQLEGKVPRVCPAKEESPSNSLFPMCCLRLLQNYLAMIQAMTS